VRGMTHPIGVHRLLGFIYLQCTNAHTANLHYFSHKYSHILNSHKEEGITPLPPIPELVIITKQLMIRDGRELIGPEVLSEMPFITCSVMGLGNRH